MKPFSDSELAEIIEQETENQLQGHNGPRAGGSDCDLILRLAKELVAARRFPQVKWKKEERDWRIVVHADIRSLSHRNFSMQQETNRYMAPVPGYWNHVVRMMDHDLRNQLWNVLAPRDGMQSFIDSLEKENPTVDEAKP